MVLHLRPRFVSAAQTCEDRCALPVLHTQTGGS
jgi:hypothetical protein